MTYNEIRIEALKEIIHKRGALVSKLEDLNEKKKQTRINLAVLEVEAHNEQVDVINLEEKTFTSMVFDLLGKKEQKLEKERGEARDAAAKRDAVSLELENISAEARAYETKIEDCERKYISILSEHLYQIKDSCVSPTEYSLILNNILARCGEDEKKMDAVIEIIRDAEEIADQVILELSAVDDLVARDVIGGGVLLKAQKRGRIGEVERLYKMLEKKLSLLNKKTSDIDLGEEIELGGLCGVDDFFWDNFFTNWGMIDRVHEADISVKKTLAQIRELQEQFSIIKKYNEAEKEILQAELDNLNII